MERPRGEEMVSSEREKPRLPLGRGCRLWGQLVMAGAQITQRP